MITIAQAESRQGIELIRELFIEYERSLDIDLCFQGFDQELDSLPGEYAPPSGRLILAYNGDKLAGCVALRAISKEACEMKRLYVRPSHRGAGIGRMLAEAVIREATATGYRRMFLDTLASMHEALALYRSLGFRETEAYRYNPCEDCRFMVVDL
jgi:ribosomal protein S18 acetylase RimI-like enzyme